MALSDTYSKSPATGYKLQVEWTATQNTSANTTTITQKVYWVSTGSGYSVDSGMTRDGWQEINGTRGNFSANPSLSGNQKKKIDEQTTTVTHNTDGSKSVTLEASFSPMVTLNGDYIPSITVSKSYDLNDIPRESSLTSSRNWTAGNNLGISINRASSSHDHKIEVIVDGNSIYTRDGIGTSATMYFTEAHNTEIFNELVGATSKPATIKLTTYKGSTQVGDTKSYPGTVTSPSASTTASSMNFNIGGSREIKLSTANSDFRHTLRFYVGSTLIKTQTGVEDKYTWEPTTAEITDMYNATSKVKTATSKVEIDTLYNSKKVRSTTSKTGTATVTSSNPTFGTGYTYADTNPITVALTSNSQYIIQKKSTVQVTIPTGAKAVGVNGASIVKYQCTIQGITKEVTHHATNNMIFPAHGTLTANTNTTIQVKAIDSRGNSTTTTKTLTLLPYSEPVMNASAVRVNGFEADTKVNLNGSISMLTIGGANKNSIQAMGYRYKLSTDKEYPTTYTNFTYATATDKYTATSVTLPLDNTKNFLIEYMIQDKLGTYTFVVKVGTGKPVMFVDGVKNSVGVGKIPTESNSLEVDGTIHLPANRFAERGAGINMHNSDIVGVNQIFTQDPATTDEEAFQWAKSTTPAGSTLSTDYDSFRVFDGAGYLNSLPMFSTSKNPIATGSHAMAETTTVTLGKNVNDVPNGIILVWGYSGSSDWCTSVIMKKLVQANPGHYWSFSLGLFGGSTGVKHVRIYLDRITGHARNLETPNSNAQLRYVYEF